MFYIPRITLMLYWLVDLLLLKRYTLFNPRDKMYGKGLARAEQLLSAADEAQNDGFQQTNTPRIDHTFTP